MEEHRCRPPLALPRHHGLWEQEHPGSFSALQVSKYGTFDFRPLWMS